VSEPTLDFCPAPASDVESCELDGARLVWRGPILHRLDCVGGLVWQCFDGKTTIGDICRILAEEFTATEAEVQRDVAALCAELLDEGLLAGGSSTMPEPPPLIRMGWPPSVPLDPGQHVAFATGRFVALTHDFGIRTDDARLATYFDRSLRAFAATGSPAHWYSVLSGPGNGERYRIYLDDEGILAAHDADLVARYLLWHINYEVIKTSPNHMLIHAAGATIGRQAVVLPGDMNAGKTTLVAGLVLDGFDFLTDEIVALNLETGLIDPYPRPLNVGSSSWEVLPSLRPPDRDNKDPIPELLWHVDPTSIRSDAVAPATPLRWVVAPRYESGSTTQLQPLSRPDAVQLLHRQAFNRHQVGNSGIRTLVRAVAPARCARLIIGDLASGVASVRRFVEDDESE